MKEQEIHLVDLEYYIFDCALFFFIFSLQRTKRDPGPRNVNIDFKVITRLQVNDTTLESGLQRSMSEALNVHKDLKLLGERPPDELEIFEGKKFR